jgi:hypothetical protein
VELLRRDSGGAGDVLEMESYPRRSCKTLWVRDGVTEEEMHALCGRRST